MNNEIKLEFERHENGQAGGFYRYRFDRTIFWFRQEPDGGIRTVNISDEKYPDIEFYADIAPDTLYPYQIRFRLPPVVICSYKDEDRFTRKFQYCCNIRSTLQHFFETSSHARFQWENHEDKEIK